MIHGLSERRRLPRLGKIHLGIKSLSQGGKEYPKAVDYFVLPHEEGKPQVLTALGKQIAAVYGERPRELDVLFPCEEPSEFFAQNYKCYRSGIGLWCKGDGQAANRLDEKGALQEVECKGEECLTFKEKKCKPMANLMFILPRVSMGGVFQIDTSSINSIIDINSGIDHVRAVCGRVSLVPCTLRVTARPCTVEGKRKNVYTMQVSLATFAQIQALRGQLDEIRQLVGGCGVALPAPQQAPFEETDLIPASVQDAPKQLPAGPQPPDTVTEDGEVLDADLDVSLDDAPPESTEALTTQAPQPDASLIKPHPPVQAASGQQTGFLGQPLPAARVKSKAKPAPTPAGKPAWTF